LTNRIFRSPISEKQTVAMKSVLAAPNANVLRRLSCADRAAPNVNELRRPSRAD
jgi:hypothetical protein